MFFYYIKLFYFNVIDLYRFIVCEFIGGIICDIIIEFVFLVEDWGWCVVLVIMIDCFFNVELSDYYLFIVRLFYGNGCIWKVIMYLLFRI